MPVLFSELSNLPDILATYRHSLFFPQVTGVDNKTLTLVKTRVTLPQEAVGHIQVKLLGHSIGFRGGLSFENIITVSFYELSNGIVIRSLAEWLKLVRNRADGTSLTKAEYAHDGVFEVYNTTGKLAMSFKLVNLFPVIVQYPDFGEEATAAEFQVQFNVDQVLLESGEQLSMAEFNRRVAGA